MPKLQVPQVTHASTDLEIIEAIEAAGQHQYYWRTNDYARPGDNNPLSWVIPNDVGHSSSRDTELLRRLKQMVKRGILEISYTYRSRNVARSCFEPSYRSTKSLPRFRVAKGGREFISS